MSIVAASLTAEVSVSGADKAKSDLAGVGKSVGGTAGMLAGGLATAALAVGAVLVGVGVKATQMAGDFQSGMLTLVTGAGESKANLQMVSDGILKMAVDTGTSTKDLTAGMFMIESAGFHGAAGLLVLKAAAEGAKVGNASLADVANGVTTAMTDYASKNLTAAQATNFLIATVANGKTHMGDLARSMSTILPTAAAVGVSLTDVGGAMATMTGEGTGAAQASTYLRQMLMAMASPAHAGAAALKSIGLTTAEVSADMKKSLPDTLAMIMKHLKDTYVVGSPQYMTALKNIAGGAKQMQGMLELTGEHLKTFGGNVTLVTDAMHKGGNSIIGWSDVQGTFNFKLSQAKEVVETLMIRIGTQLLPILTQLLGAVIPIITSLTNWITTSGVLQTAVTGVTNAIGWMSSTVGGAFGFMAQQASVQTLKMKETSLTNSQATAQGVVANLQQQRTNAEQELQHSASDVQRHMLEMRINAINHSLAQEQGVVANYVKQRQGVDAQLAAMQPSVALHMLKAKETAITTSLASAEGVLGSYALQRRRLEAELSVTKDAVTRHMLEMKLQATNTAIAHEQGVVAAFEKQKTGVERQVADMKSKVVAQQGNLILQIAGLFNHMKDSVIGAWNRMVNSPAFHTFQDIMKKVADFLKSVFMPVVGQFATMFQTQLQPAFEQIKTSIQPLMPLFELLGAIIGGVIVVNIGIFISMLGGLASALSTFIGGIATFIAGIVQAVSGIVEFIGGIVQFIVDLFTGHFDKLGGDLKGIWKGIQDIFSGGLKIVQGLFQATIGTIITYVTSFISNIIGFFQHLWDQLVGHSIIPDMVNGIIKWFLNLVSSCIKHITDFVTGVIGWIQHMHDLAVEWITMMVFAFIVRAEALRSQMIAKIEALVNGVINWFVSLHNQAMQNMQNFVTGIINWFLQLHDEAMQKMQDVIDGITGILNNFIAGADQFGFNLLKHIANGISNGIGQVGNAMHNAVTTIGSYLPHSPAKKGELQHLNEYGPTIMQHIAQGMESGIPALKTTISHVVQPMAQLGSPQFSGGVHTFQLPAMQPTTQAQSDPYAGRPLILQLDGRTLATATLPHLATALRYSIGVTGR